MSETRGNPKLSISSGRESLYFLEAFGIRYHMLIPRRETKMIDRLLSHLSRIFNYYASSVCVCVCVYRLA